MKGDRRVRSSPIVEEKVQKHLAEAARLLRGPMLNAPDWAMDIEATAHAIQNEFNEKRKWNADNRDMIKLVKDKIKVLSSNFNIRLKEYRHRPVNVDVTTETPSSFNTNLEERLQIRLYGNTKLKGNMQINIFNR